MLESIVRLLVSFPYAIAVGVLVAIACAALGVFVILKRVVFIGVVLSEMAACGIAGALMVGMPPLVGALALTLAAVAMLALPFENQRIPRDAFMGIWFVAAASVSVLLVARSGLGLHAVRALLYGDLILATAADFVISAALLIPVLACLLLFLRPILYAFLDREAATVLGIRPARWEILFFVLLGLVVGAASKIAGVLLVFCYLVVPAAIGLLLARRIEVVLVIAVATAVVFTLAGLAVAFAMDLPTNQTICAVGCFLTVLVWGSHALCRSGMLGQLLSRKMIRDSS